jgi:ribosome biogenesis GTPase / thiamine phosphate phosphatase
MRLPDLGWNDDFSRAFAAWASMSHVYPGRVAIEFNHNYRICMEDADIPAVIAGRLKHRTDRRSELPAVGDWVAVRKRPDEDRGSIVAVLPRRSWFSRRMVGHVTGEQVVAANVDIVFLVMGLDGNFNLRRLERYLLLARESGAAPVILLTKPDLSADVARSRADVSEVAGDVAVHVVSPKFDEGIDQVGSHLPRGITGALLGSSGVGKSTIINRLTGEETQKTREVRDADSRGRHTTTHRELVVLPNGGLIIDTPGMRELQLWDVSEAVRETFNDIEELALSCHFTNCRHRDEPRCAVKAAIDSGSLTAERLASYHKLQDELAELTRQQEERGQIEEKRRTRRRT